MHGIFLYSISSNYSSHILLCSGMSQFSALISSWVQKCSSWIDLSLWIAFISWTWQLLATPQLPPEQRTQGRWQSQHVTAKAEILPMMHQIQHQLQGATKNKFSACPWGKLWLRSTCREFFSCARISFSMCHFPLTVNNKRQSSSDKLKIL